MNRLPKAIILAAATALTVYFSVAASGKNFQKTEENTVVSETTVFKECNHSQNSSYTLPEMYAGLTPEDAAQKLGGRLIEFESGLLSIEKTDPLCCGHHYRLYLEGNTIKAKNLRTGLLKNEFPTAPSQFSEKDLELLKNGITADSESELSSLIEDYTS